MSMRCKFCSNSDTAVRYPQIRGLHHGFPPDPPGSLQVTLWWRPGWHWSAAPPPRRRRRSRLAGWALSWDLRPPGHAQNGYMVFFWRVGGWYVVWLVASWVGLAFFQRSFQHIPSLPQVRDACRAFVSPSGPTLFSVGGLGSYFTPFFTMNCVSRY